MAAELAIWILSISLIISIGVILVLYRSLDRTRTREQKYYRVIVNYTHLVSHCTRCRRILDEKIKRKNAAKTGL